MLDHTFYSDPTPALIFTAIVIALCLAVPVWIAIREFGTPRADRSDRQGNPPTT